MPSPASRLLLIGLVKANTLTSLAEDEMFAALGVGEGEKVAA